MVRIHVLRRLAFAGMLLAFCVVVFGAYVRLTNAGLGCPDWPGCYGHATPAAAAAADAGTTASPLHVGKAWREMIHRYAAGALSILVFVVAGLAIFWRRQPGIPLALSLSLVPLILFQALLGMWTVTHLVNPTIVTLHLIFGLTMLCLLWWLWMTLRRRSTSSWSASIPGGVVAALRPAPQGLRTLATVALVLLALQIILGGWTSTHYAATACPDFPKCQASWWPQADYDSAFDPVREFGINYEGGNLALPARVAIHFVHRLGAIIATLGLLFAAIVTLRRYASGRWAATAVLAALALQLIIGISMVTRGFPLWLATAHNAGAALLLLSALALNRTLRRT